MNDYDVIVVGQGVAGLAMAREAAARGLHVGAFEAAFFGGLVANRMALDFFPEADGLSGMDYAADLAAANARAGVTVHTRGVLGLRADAQGYTVECEGDRRHAARAVVIASGARLKKLDVPGEERLEGRGVAQCAECDGPLFRDLAVVVAGGGDSALQSALILARECQVVHIVHDGPAPTAHPDVVAAAREVGNIAWLPSTRIVAIVGEAVVTGVQLEGAQGASALAVDGVFGYVGLQPNTGFVPSGVTRDADGWLQVDAGLETAWPGVWAVGQVRAGFAGLLSAALADASRVAAAVAARLRPDLDGSVGRGSDR